MQERWPALSLLNALILRRVSSSNRVCPAYHVVSCLDDAQILLELLSLAPIDRTSLQYFAFNEIGQGAPPTEIFVCRISSR